MVQSILQHAAGSAIGTISSARSWFFCGLAAAYIVLAVYQLYLNQWLQIRWRRWMTENYLSQWLDSANHYRMQLLGDAADNPDQRIAEDIRQFIDCGNDVGLLPSDSGCSTPW